MSDGTFNPGKRRLCPDGACIGLIGDDGRCRVCGISASTGGTAASAATPGDLRDSSHAGNDDGNEDLADRDAYQAGSGGHADEGALDDTAASARHAPGSGELGFRPDRRLCDDGSCIGVVGADGTCGVCGRRAD